MTQVPVYPYQPPTTFATSWTLIGKVVHGQTWEKRDALETLLNRYMPAIRAYLLTRKWAKPGDVDDLVHEFIASQVMDHHLLAKANKDRGKFRNYLLTALRNFTINQFRKKELVFAEIQGEPSFDGAPERVFEGEWARLVIQEALEAMERQCRQMGRQAVWGLFEYRLLKPVFDGQPSPPYAELIKRFDLKSPAQAANTLVTAKRMFARVLRDVVAQYTLDEQEVEEEIADLMLDLAKS